MEGRDDINEDDEGVMVISPTIFLVLVIGIQRMAKMILQSKAQGYLMPVFIGM